MKTNLNIALELIDKGLSAKTLSKLTEGQIKTLHKKLVGEAQVTTSQYVDLTADEVKGGAKIPDTVMAGKKNITISPNPKSPGGVRVEPTSEEVTEDDEIEQDPFQLQSTQDKRQVGPGEYGNNPKVDKEMDAEDADGMGIMEKKSEKNPWAICTAQLGKEFGTRERHLWSAKEKNKYERCVKDVKKSLKEGKNPVSLFLENEIMRIVEKNLPPRITKRDLVKYISEQGPAVAPTKPKPTVKPGKPEKKPRPSHPGKNPNPGVNPAPKAISPEKAKDEVIDLIINLLEK